jgi:hypothetical protein
MMKNQVRRIKILKTTMINISLMKKIKLMINKFKKTNERNNLYIIVCFHK